MPGPLYRAGSYHKDSIPQEECWRLLNPDSKRG